MISPRIYLHTCVHDTMYTYSYIFTANSTAKTAAAHMREASSNVLSVFSPISLLMLHTPIHANHHIRIPPLPAVGQGRHTGVIIVSTGALVTSIGVLVTSTGVLVTSTGALVTSTGALVTSTGVLVISTGVLVTSTGVLVTSTGVLVASFGISKGSKGRKM